VSLRGSDRGSLDIPAGNRVKRRFRRAVAAISSLLPIRLASRVLPPRFINCLPLHLRPPPPPAAGPLRPCATEITISYADLPPSRQIYRRPFGLSSFLSSPLTSLARARFPPPPSRLVQGDKAPSGRGRPREALGGKHESLVQLVRTLSFAIGRYPPPPPPHSFSLFRSWKPNAPGSENRQPGRSLSSNVQSIPAT
jgi:hypothetical protein